jgi:xanthine dehydrogenase accessory factor
MSPLSTAGRPPSRSAQALRQQAEGWLQQAIPACWVELVQVRGSAPRDVGTRMLVSAQGVAGTIGGGHLEWQAMALARDALAGRVSLPLERSYTLGPSLGQCCGGAVQLRLYPLAAACLAQWPTEPPLFHLQLHGAGHVGRAVMRLLADLPCEVVWVDERAEEFPAEASGLVAPQVLTQSTDCPEAEVRRAPPGAYFLVMTHRHDLDFTIVETVLRRKDFGFLGLIGSATKAASFRHKLAARGAAPEPLARLVSPIGLPGITGKAPEVIAISVVAQLLQVAQGALTR